MTKKPVQALLQWTFWHRTLNFKYSLVSLGDAPVNRSNYDSVDHFVITGDLHARTLDKGQSSPKSRDLRLKQGMKVDNKYNIICPYWIMLSVSKLGLQWLEGHLITSCSPGLQGKVMSAVTPSAHSCSLTHARLLFIHRPPVQLQTFLRVLYLLCDVDIAACRQDKAMLMKMM